MIHFSGKEMTMRKHGVHLASIVISILTMLFAASVPGSGQNWRKPSDKIYSSITQTIKRLKKDGVTAANAKQMNVARRYNSSLTRFDAEGRFGVHLEVTEVSPDLMARLHGLGGDVVMALPYSRLVAVYLPIDKIEDVASLNEVKIIRPITGGVTNAGAVTSEGDSIHHAWDVRTDLNVKGDSVRVGVISDGCTNWNSSKTSGDLPADFDSTHFTFGGVNKMGCGDEGTAMMEIVHDLAPNADLYYYGALCDPAGSAAHIDAIHRLVREKGCKVIVDDLNWWDQPMFEDGTPATNSYIAAAVQWAIDTGVTYVASAGNWANGGQTDRSHYQAMYQTVSMFTIGGVGNPWTVKNLQGPIPNFPHIDNCGGPCPPFCGPCPPDPYHQLHDFDPGPGEDVGFKVVVPIGRCMTVILQWNDPWGAPVSDYDLYLFNANLAFQKARSDTNIIDPMERITYCNQYYPQGETLNIVINRFAGPPKLLKMFIYGCSWADNQYHTIENSIYEHDGVADEITVGAVPYNNINNIELYSSRGNFDVYFPAYQSREKPDVVTIDGGKITGAGSFGDSTGGAWRFYGTSASAPHVAAMAALLLSKCPTMTPQQVHQKFERTAVDLGNAGFDVTYGHGRIDIERAMLEVNTTAGSSGPYGMNTTVNVPMFYATPDGYAVSNVMVTGGASQPNQVNSKVGVVAGSPYADAGVPNLGCPTIKRWYQLTQNGGVNGQFNAQITSYIDETERAAANIPDSMLRIIHWNGAYFDILPKTHPPIRVGDTWKVTGTFANASFSPFFVGDLARGVDITSTRDDSGSSNQIDTVSFTIKNTGNGWDTLSAHALDTKGWSLSPIDATLGLTPNQSKTVSIAVTIPAGESVGSIDTIRFSVVSLSDSSIIDSSFATVKKNSAVITEYYAVSDGWNMLSVPRTVNDRRASALYPTAISNAFCYAGTYSPCDTLKYGSGYWVKFKGDQSVGITGSPRTEDTIVVTGNWNMIGSLSEVVDTDNIEELPHGVITSSYFGYDGSYYAADSIRPGNAYWVRANGNGKLVLKKSGALNASRPRSQETLELDSVNSLIVTDRAGHSQTLYFGQIASVSSITARSGMPPPPPDGSFDVRFQSQQYIEGYQTDQTTQNLTINIQGGKYPLTLRWHIREWSAMFWLRINSIKTRLEERDGTMDLTLPISSFILTAQPSSHTVLPSSYSLQQNYPNPFNPVTTIRYAIPARELVTLKVFDVLGQEVSTLVDEVQDAGERSVTFNANALSSGIYSLRMTAGAFTSIKRMLLIK